MARLPTSPEGRLRYLCSQEGEGWVARRLSGRDTNLLSLRDARLYVARDEILKHDYFAPWERLWLCAGSISSTAMRSLRRQRIREFHAYSYAYQAKYPKGSTEDILRAFNSFLKRRYERNDWLMKVSGDYDPYAQLESWKRDKNIQDSPRKHLPRKKLPEYNKIVERTQAKEKRLTPAQRTLTKYAQKRGRE